MRVCLSVCLCGPRVSTEREAKRGYQSFSVFKNPGVFFIIYESESYQHALLPSQELIESDPGNKLGKHPIFREIFKLIFPGTPVKPNHIKAKLRWVQETYYKEKKKLSLTGAGTLLEDMDASNPVSLCNLTCNDMLEC